MKTDLLVLAGMALAWMTVPVISHAEENDDWALNSPLALGEPMEDCDIQHPDAIASQTTPVLPAGKVAPPDVVPAVAPVVAPAGSTTQAPRHLSPAALITFALIASPGTALPQTGGSRD